VRVGVDTDRLRDGTFPLHATTSSFTSGYTTEKTCGQFSTKTASKLQTISYFLLHNNPEYFLSKGKTMKSCTQITGKPPKYPEYPEENKEIVVGTF
jgi:hypothetical protein